MMTRISRTPRRVISLLLVVPFLLSGCLWYFYPADPTPELLFYESFDWFENDDTWYASVEPGYVKDARIVNGRLEVYGPRHFLQTRDEFPTNLTILIEWSVTNGDIISQLYPAPHAVDPDFTVTIDEFDLTVELYLYRFVSDSPRMDTVRILDFLRRDVVEPVSTETAGVTRGHLEVRLTPKGDQMQVDVSVPEINLEMSALATAAGESKSAITIGVSGLSNDPRSLEEICIYQRQVNLGGLR
ncbi:MAG: hypothetical protein KAU31_07860 [Spirochaetaceae bacterium]|nr:hypothetical protein [Spirochaetaceae bacterium]